MNAPAPGRAGEEPVAARHRLLAMINASWTTQAIGAAVELGVPDRIAEHPASVAALAQACGTDPVALRRLLRALASLGLCTEYDGDRYMLAREAHLLRQEVPGSLWGWSLLCARTGWPHWGKLADCVRSGRSARRMQRGVDDFGHLADDERAARIFNHAMTGITHAVAARLARAVDFDGPRRIVDVGGGHAQLLIALLEAHPAARGVVFDLAHATAGAAQALGRAGLAGRAEIVTGDFFRAVPEAADDYVLKSIVHDWDDAASLAILGRCAKAMAPHSRLVLVERLASERVGANARDQAIARADLNMLIGTGGCERTERQYRDLVEGAGLRVRKVVALVDEFSAIIATLP